MSKIDQIREAAENDLLTFVKLVAPHLMLGAVHEELIQWWQRQDAKQNQLVLLPRGHMKSKLIAYRTAWWITKHPETTILYVSATADLAEKQLYAIKQIIDSPIYRRYWSDMIHPEEGKREKWAVAEIAVDHPRRKEEGIRDATCKAVGLTSNTTGFHADVVVLDDIVDQVMLILRKDEKRLEQLTLSWLPLKTLVLLSGLLVLVIILEIFMIQW